jgi:hypothetical protein
MRHHLVALAQLGHAGAGRCDRPGRLRPEGHRSRAADLPAADPDKLIPVADAGGDDVDQDLACGRRHRLVHLEDLDRFAECCDPGRSHPVRRTLLASVMRRGPLWRLARGVRREQVTDDLPVRPFLRPKRLPLELGGGRLWNRLQKRLARPVEHEWSSKIDPLLHREGVAAEARADASSRAQ